MWPPPPNCPAIAFTSKSDRLRKLTFVSCGDHFEEQHGRLRRLHAEQAIDHVFRVGRFGANRFEVGLRDRGRQQPAAQVRLHVREDATLQQDSGQAVLLVKLCKDVSRLRAGGDQSDGGLNVASPTEANRNQPVSVPIAANSGIAISGVSFTPSASIACRIEPARRFRRRVLEHYGAHIILAHMMVDVDLPRGRTANDVRHRPQLAPALVSTTMCTSHVRSVAVTSLPRTPHVVYPDR